MRSVLLRLLGLLTLSLWVGGFTFYSAVVVPILHDHFDAAEAGAVTQRVTHRLNALAAVALFAVCATIRPRSAQSSAHQVTATVVLVACSALILIVLVLLHHIMDRHLATVGIRGFYPLHRAYLVLSTAQWLVNLALLAVTQAPQFFPGPPPPARSDSSLAGESHR